MRLERLAVGFVPLVDAAPLIVAQEMGFAAEEGFDFDLRRTVSWSALRDMLAFGQVSAAHMLAPVPVAGALGLGGAPGGLLAISVLSANGNVIGVSRQIEDRLTAAGHGFGFDDAHAAGQALMDMAPAPLRIAVPFPFSLHAELIDYWLSALGRVLPPERIAIRTVPPPLMAEALAAGEVDVFCVGEPWGSGVVDAGLGALLLPGAAIWSSAPEKVLAVREDWARTHPGTAARLIRAIWRAGRWLSAPQSRSLAAEMLARPQYLDLPAERIDRALTGKLTVTAQGRQREVDGFLRFHHQGINRPWPAYGAWIAERLARRLSLPQEQQEIARTSGAKVFDDALYCEALGENPTPPASVQHIATAPTTPPDPVIPSRSAASLTDPIGASLAASTAPPPPLSHFFDGAVFDPSADFS